MSPPPSKMIRTLLGFFRPDTRDLSVYALESTNSRKVVRLILRLFRADSPVPLGRWGHHWETKRIHQRYYD
jgi:hypothetical protein